MRLLVARTVAKLATEAKAILRAKRASGLMIKQGGPNRRCLGSGGRRGAGARLMYLLPTYPPLFFSSRNIFSFRTRICLVGARV